MKKVCSTYVAESRLAIENNVSGPLYPLQPTALATYSGVSKYYGLLSWGKTRQSNDRKYKSKPS